MRFSVIRHMKLVRAQEYFAQQIQPVQARQAARASALQEAAV